MGFGVEGAGEFFEEVLLLEAAEVVGDHAGGDFHHTADEECLPGGEGVGEELVEEGKTEAEEVLEVYVHVF